MENPERASLPVRCRKAKQRRISGIMKTIYSPRYVVDGSEQEVLEELGDPRLIAKTLIDTDDGSTQEDYGEYSSYGGSYDSGYGNGMEDQAAAGETLEEIY